jgi:hypothetical protein
MQRELRGMREELGSLPGGITDMQGGLERMSAQLGEVLENVRPMDEDLAAVEKAVRDLAPQLEGMKQELDHLRTDLAGLPFISKS